MTRTLEDIYANKINLYEELEIPLDGAPQSVPLAAVKKQYRKLALIYHPDKQPDSPDAIHKFHTISLATHVLTDENLRAQYDTWLDRRIDELGRNDKQRNELIEKLNRREYKAQKKDTRDFTHDIARIQEYGATLRKMKHFKVPYGDWKTLNLSETVQKSETKLHTLYDCSTLRIEIENGESVGNLADKQALINTLRQILGVPALHDLYYSSRNDYSRDESIVAYVVFPTPRESQYIYKRWKNDRSSASWGPILEISPWIPTSYYKNFTKKADLDPEIVSRVNDETIVID